MNSARIVVLLALVAASATGGFLAYRYWASHDASDAAATVQLPGFSLPDLNADIRSSSEWDGQIRLVNFWATWCPPCRREIPLLVDLQDRYRDDIQIVGIAIDDLDAVQDYAREQTFNYPVLVGQQEAIELGNDVLADWIGLPFTAFVDASGRVVRVHVGELHEEQAAEFLGEML